MVEVLLDREPKAAREFQQRHSLSYPVLHDGEAKLYQRLRDGDLLSAFTPRGLTATPYNVVLDRQGRVQYRAVGFDEGEVRKTVEKLLQ